MNKRPRSKANGIKPPETLTSQVFEGATVEIDGKIFAGCTFANCTLVWRGGTYDFRQCRIVGRRELRIEECSLAILTFRLAEMLGLLVKDELAPTGGAAPVAKGGGVGKGVRDPVKKHPGKSKANPGRSH